MYVQVMYIHFTYKKTYILCMYNVHIQRLYHTCTYNVHQCIYVLCIIKYVHIMYVQCTLLTIELCTYVQKCIYILHITRYIHFMYVQCTFLTIALCIYVECIAKYIHITYNKVCTFYEFTLDIHCTICTFKIHQ